jgi:hypothetical protein
VVVSDLQMPGMDGITLLSSLRKVSPDTVRVLLTGHADVDAAIAAVNEGNIFRFLRKPCPPGALLRALEASVEQYRLITAERVLLEQTLRGSLKTLTDILAFVNPVAFGRAIRSRKIVGEFAILGALASLQGGMPCDTTMKQLPLQEVQPGMVFAEDVKNHSGLLLIARGQEVTPSLVERIKNIARNSKINAPVLVIVPAQPIIPPPRAGAASFPSGLHPAGWTQPWPPASEPINPPRASAPRRS